MKTESELGRQIAIYRGRNLRARDLFILYVPGGLLVLGPLAYAVYRSNLALTRFGPAAAARWSQPWYLLSLIALLVLILVALRWLRQSHRCVAVYTGGLRLALSGSRSLRWDQITGIATEITQERFLGLPLRRRYRAVLYPGIGKPVHLESLSDLSGLIRQIKDRVYPILLPALQARYQAGEWLEFGPVALRSSSLRIRGQEIPWSQVEQVSVRSGEVVVELSHRRPVKVPVSLIPNLEILFQILQPGVTV